MAYTTQTGDCTQLQTKFSLVQGEKQLFPQALFRCSENRSLPMFDLETKPRKSSILWYLRLIGNTSVNIPAKVRSVTEWWAYFTRVKFHQLRAWIHVWGFTGGKVSLKTEERLAAEGPGHSAWGNVDWPPRVGAEAVNGEAGGGLSTSLLDVMTAQENGRLGFGLGLHADMRNQNSPRRKANLCLWICPQYWSASSWKQPLPHLNGNKQCWTRRNVGSSLPWPEHMPYSPELQASESVHLSRRRTPALLAIWGRWRTQDLGSL